MGFRFRRTIKILPGIRLNFSRSGVSTSVGVRGAHVTVGHGKVRETVGLRGSSLSYTDVEGTHPEPHGEAQPAEVAEALPKGRAWRGWLWVVLMLAIAGLFAYNFAYADTEGDARNPFPTPEYRGSEQRPLVVSKTDEQLRSDTKLEEAHSANESHTTIATVVLAVFTVLLWGANVWLIWDARRVSDRQARDTQAALREQTRSADEMHAVAEATKNNAVLMSGMFAKQMRAYISVDIGGGIYQDANHVFEARPSLTNNGLTPARNVCYKAMAGIYDGSSWTPIIFPAIGDLIINDVGIAPRQSFTIRAIMAGRVPESDVPAIMEGNTRRLFAWGKVTYDDVYNGSWETNFCISYSFQKIGNDVKVFGNFYHTNNKAT